MTLSPFRRQAWTYLAAIAIAASLASPATFAHCQAPFFPSAPKLQPSGSSAGRISMRMEAERLNPGAPFRVIPPLSALRSDEKYKKLGSYNQKTDQATLLRAAMLTAAHIEAKDFTGARAFLDAFKAKAPTEWWFENSDAEGSVEDVRASNSLLLQYLVGAHAATRLATEDLTSQQLWNQIAIFASAATLLEELGWSAILPLDSMTLPPMAQTRIANELERLNSLPPWQSRAELADNRSLLGLGYGATGGPALFGTTDHGPFSVSTGGSGGGIVIAFGLRCHHDYLGGFTALADRFRKPDAGFEMASVILSNGNHVVQLDEAFAEAVGLDTDHFIIAASDIKMLRGGARLSNENPLTKVVATLQKQNKALVFWEHPLAQKSKAQARGGQADVLHSFVSAMTRTYPEIGIYKDPPTDRLPALVAGLQAARLNETKVRVIVDTTFGVELAEPANVVARKFEKTAGIEVVYYSDTTPAVKATSSTPNTTIAITGHSNEKLTKLVRDLGEKGFFKNNFVLFESCGTVLKTQQVAEIIGRYGASGVYSFDSSINYRDAASLLKVILETKASGKDGNLRSLPVEATKSLPKAPELPMHGAWTICRTRGVTRTSPVA